MGNALSGEEDQDQVEGDGNPPRRTRVTYTSAQRERAIHYLNRGITCRNVARIIGLTCSSGTVIRWRKQERIREANRRRLENRIAGRRRR